jgi:hypothetical protein
MNKVERDAYIDQQALTPAPIDPSKTIDQVFGDKGIAARMELLDALSRYCALLYDLANSDAPDKLKSNTQSLSDSLKSLSDTAAGLANGDNAGFKEGVGILTGFFTPIAQLILQTEMKKALDQAIKDGEPVISKSIVALQRDLQLAYERRRSSLNNQWQLVLKTYNADFLGGKKPEVLRAQQDASLIKNQLDALDALSNSNAADAIAAMGSAHTALVKYAKSQQHPQDVADLIDAMQAYVRVAKDCLDALAPVLSNQTSSFARR